MCDLGSPLASCCIVSRMADSSEGVTLVSVTKVESTEQATVQIVVNGDDAEASGDVVLAVSEEEKTVETTAEATPPPSRSRNGGRCARCTRGGKQSGGKHGGGGS